MEGNQALAQLLRVWEEGGTAGVCTVVRTFGSAPQPPGTRMVVTPEGAVVGSVSGGCVESAAYQLAIDVVNNEEPQLERYGVSDATAFSVGLTCGGTLDIFVEPISRKSFPDFSDFAADVAADNPVAIMTIIDHPDRAVIGHRRVIRPHVPITTHDPTGVLGSTHDEALRLLAAGRSEVVSATVDGGAEVSVFVNSHASRPRMLIFGAVDFTSALVSQGALLGYRVTVCDARATFATHARFPGAEDVVVEWPHRYLAAEVAYGRVDSRTVVCVLTHDPKFDIPLLQTALAIPELGFVGAMGSRRTHVDRLERLYVSGALTREQIDRLASPIGLDLGSRTSAETAVSIAAQIIARRRGGTGSPLVDTTGPIHYEGP